MIQLRPADTAHFRTGSPFDKQRLFIQIKCKANTPWKGLSLRGTYPRERSPKYTNWAPEKICDIRSLSLASTCWSKLGESSRIACEACYYSNGCLGVVFQWEVRSGWIFCFYLFFKFNTFLNMIIKRWILNFNFNLLNFQTWNWIIYLCKTFNG